MEYVPKDRPASSEIVESHISFALTLAMAVACGVTVANIYYNQPMLAIIEADFPDHVAAASMVPTVTQLGFAVGLLLLLPLGDRMERRTLVLVQTVGLALSLIAASLAPNVYFLVVASIIVGVTSTACHQIVPFAAALSAPDRRGATIGVVMSGLLSGILLGRVLAGAVASYFGWRTMFGVGFVLTVAIGMLMALVLPRCAPSTRASYGKLLGSLATLWLEKPTLRRATVVQACLFGSFSGLWTVLALQLNDRYHLGSAVAGLFGVLGAVTVLLAPLVGKLADRRGPYLVIGLGGVVMAISWFVFGIWHALPGLIVGVILLDFGQQGTVVSSQHIVHSLRPEARNRFSTVFMCGMFIGGAVGSAGANLAWALSGWKTVCAFGLLLSGFALLIHMRILNETSDHSLGQDSHTVRRRSAIGRP